MLSFPLLTAEQCAQLAESTSHRVRVRERICISSVSLIELSPGSWLTTLMQRALDRGTAHYQFGRSASLFTPRERALQPRIATYTAGQFFSWHDDVGPRPPGELWLAATVQLASGDSYRGGDLLIDDRMSGARFTASRMLGHVTVFPANWRHTVTRIQSGTRSALVCWGYAFLNPSTCAARARHSTR